MLVTKTRILIWASGLIIIYTICPDAFLETLFTARHFSNSVSNMENISLRTFNFSHGFADHNESKSEKRRTEDPWLLEQERRAAVVKEICKGWKRNLPYSTSKQYPHNLLVDEDHKVIYCYIAKVACTNWKRIWMILTGLTKVRNPQLLQHEYVHKNHEWMMLNKQPITVSALQKKLDTYKKFLVVRHPYERLLSAYRSKFEGNGTSFYKKNYARHIMKIYRKNSSSSAIPLSGDGLTFSEFVTYIINLPRGGFDEHWSSYQDSCLPCDIQYDVIAKYESLAEDAERILRFINAPNNLHFPPFKVSNTSKMLAAYMSNLTLDQKRDLYSVYKKDFRMFQYEEELDN